MSTCDLKSLFAQNCFYAYQSYIEHFAQHSKGASNLVINLHGETPLAPCHTHDFFELNYVYSGEYVNTVNGKKIVMKPGSAILMAPGTVHSVDNSKGEKMYNLLINPSYLLATFRESSDTGSLQAFLSSQSKHAPYSYLQYDPVALNDRIDQMLEEGNNRLPDSNIMIETLGIQFLLMLNRTALTASLGAPGSSSDRMTNILCYIYNHYKTVTLSVLAKEFRYSGDHISRMIYQHTGVHFSDILMGVKLNHVLEHMKNPNLSIKQISSLCGFETIEHFHRIFKKKFGTTPSQFRETYLKETASLSTQESKAPFAV